MHSIPSVHPPTPFPGFRQGFPLRGSPGPATTVPWRLQRKAQRLPRCTPLAAYAHTPGPNARLRHRSSAVSAGAHAVPAATISTTVPLQESQKRGSPEHLCSSAFPCPRKVPPRCRRHATHSLMRPVWETSRFQLSTVRHVPTLSFSYSSV
ncbi:hypothetical protein NDU88_002619 [Pleurodeles waltl]|uniref:Uncharacterized protein n=1 Tax=Pleurodeles waltl TaxID=8319 RepID=A0AAV7M148_PLEWA|nr:hypothetical protein NDU88_002619 [Pleurodeles waltl]